MEIHELNTKGITSPAYVALDDGDDTYKLDLYAKFSAINSQLTLLELADENTAHIWYGYTTTASGTATKAVSLQFGGTFSPKTGDYIVVAFSQANTASTMNLSVASGDAVSVIFTGSTGADIPKGYHIFHITVSNGAPYQYHYVGIHATATNTIRGLMSATDKSNLDTAVTDIADLKNEIEQMSGLSDDIKSALLQIAAKVAYIDDDGQEYYDALYNAFYPPVELESISAVYTQSGTVYDTDSLDDLKADLVVTAHYEDSTSAVVTSYTLSGTLEEGTSTITVSYGGKTTTFTVTVTHNSMQILHDWDFTQSLVDSVGNVTASLTASSNSNLPTRDSNGVTFDHYEGCLDLGAVYDLDQTIEITFKNFGMTYTGTAHTRLLMYGNADTTGNGLFIYRYNSSASAAGWTAYIGAWATKLSGYSSRTDFDQNEEFVLKFVIASDGTTTIYKDDTQVGTLSLKAPAKSSSNSNIYIGNKGNTSAGATLANATVTRVRIYKEVE